MNRLVTTIDRTSRGIRASIRSIANRLTRKARIKVSLTISLPPFVKLALDYSADLSREPGKPAKACPRAG